MSEEGGDTLRGEASALRLAMLDGSDVDDAVCSDIAVDGRRASVRNSFLS